MNFVPKTLQEEIVRAGEARQITESQMWLEACEHIDAFLKDQRISVPMREAEMHTRLIIAEQVWDQFKGFFAQIVQTGQMAEKAQRSVLHRMTEPFRR